MVDNEDVPIASSGEVGAGGSQSGWPRAAGNDTEHRLAVIRKLLTFSPNVRFQLFDIGEGTWGQANLVGPRFWPLEPSSFCPQGSRTGDF